MLLALTVILSKVVKSIAAIVPNTRNILATEASSLRLSKEEEEEEKENPPTLEGLKLNIAL